MELSAVARGEISTNDVSPASTAPRKRRKSTGSSSRRSPVRVTTQRAAQASSMVARGRPRTTSAGSPSPSWASTWSVPITPLASLAQA